MTPYIITVVVCAALVLLKTAKKAGAAGAVLPSSLTGLIGLAAVNHAPIFGGALLSMNAFNLCICAVFGAPGLIALLLLRAICAM